MGVKQRRIEGRGCVALAGAQPVGSLEFGMRLETLRQRGNPRERPL